MQKAKGGPDPRKKDRDAEPRKVHQARDSLCRKAFSNPKRAGDLARDFGPEDFSGKLAAAPAKVMPSKFVSEVLRPCECDGRFRMETKPRGLPPVEFVLEAKSAKSKKALAQLLSYMFCALLEGLTGVHAPAAVCGILLHTGARPWKRPLSLEDLLPGLAELGKRVLNIHIHIVDLARMKPEDLFRGSKEVTAVLLALYFSCASRRDGVDVMYWMETIFSLAGNSDLRVPLAAFFLSEYHEVSKEMVSLALRRACPKDGETIMASAADEFRAEGRAEGKAEGKVEMLTDVLQDSFGPLPHQYRERIAEAGPREIKEWLLRYRGSSSLDQVFNGHGKG